MTYIPLSNSKVPFDLVRVVIPSVADDNELFSCSHVIYELENYYPKTVVQDWTWQDIEDMEIFIEEELRLMAIDKFLRLVEYHYEKGYYELRKKPKSRVTEVQKNQLSLPLEAQLFSGDDYATEEIFVEGAANSSVSTTYEREPKARRICLNIYGYACVICGFNFESEFGEMGRSYIHVHHLEPLHQGERQTNPENDLRPVCPNCHAMLHKRVPPFSIEEMKEIRRKAKE